MTLSRRIFLQAGLAATAGLAPSSASALLPAPPLGVPSNPGYFPHAIRRLPTEPPKQNLVLSHWHFFPITFDDRPEEPDTYTRSFLSVNGEGGRHAAYGGMLRDRPIPLDPFPTHDVQELAAELDIRYAREAGVNGFLFNFSSVDPKQGYFAKAAALYRAVAATNSPFRIAPCIDLAASPRQLQPDQVVELFLPLLRHSAALVMADGRPLLNSFCSEVWEPERWRAVLYGFERAGQPVCFMPMFLRPERTTPAHLDVGDIIGWWSGNHPEGVKNMARKARTARERGKQFIWSVWPQDFRPKDQWYAEARNSEIFRQSWEDAIAFNPEHVAILTWNDYAESSFLRPSVGTQFAFADLNRYYADWYQGKVRPEIERDVLYYFHRRDFTGADHAAVPDRPPMKMMFGLGPSDDAEAVAFLREPGTIEIENDGGRFEYQAGAGISALRASLAPGKQTFRVRRDGREVLSVASPFIVRDRWDWQDLTYRAGSSSRPALLATKEFEQ